MANPHLEQYECYSINYYYQASVIQLIPKSLGNVGRNNYLRRNNAKY